MTTLATRRALVLLALAASSGVIVSPGRKSRNGRVPARSLERAPPRGPDAEDAGSSRLLVKVTLGLGDPAPTRWDGIAHVDQGTIVSIQGWNFNSREGETIQVPKRAWRVKTKKPNFDTSRGTSWGSGSRPPYGARPTRPVGIWLELAAPPVAILAVHTVAGDFELQLQQIAGGRPVTLLGGRALVEAAVTCLPVARTGAQEDYPSLAAGLDGTCTQAGSHTRAAGMLWSTPFSGAKAGPNRER